MNSNKVQHKWNPQSWCAYIAAQQPPWPDRDYLAQVVKKLSARLPLVFSGEIKKLKQLLADVASGERFLLQGGDCAERFETGLDEIQNILKLLMQMSVVLMYAGGKPVVKVGRFAGQFAKPRSNMTEVIDGVTMFSYFGDIVNRPEPDRKCRQPDPANLLEGYNCSAAMLNIIRGLSSGGFADLHRVHSWTRDFLANSPAGQRYQKVAEGISAALYFMDACGISSDQVGGTEFFTSHEALLLDYEQALTKMDKESGLWYDMSAHLLWLGERTRQVDGAHVAFLSGIANPLGVKVGPDANPDSILRLLDILNPDNEAGRITLILRSGAAHAEEKTAALIKMVCKEGRTVIWSCDPMHENTRKTAAGHKTRDFKVILEEVRGFFSAHAAAGTVPGGVHLELTGEAVTECLGGGEGLTASSLADNYQTACDPRLNWKQSLEMAFLISEELGHRG